jgi:predicted RecA/RadA family phage recombinase
LVEGKIVEAARIKAGDQVGYGSEIVAMLETAGGDSRDGQDNGSVHVFVRPVSPRHAD